MFFWLFFFKQKTAYEMRISDWSSDVCSSDLHRRKLQIALRSLLDKLPSDLREHEEYEMLCEAARELPIAIVHLIHRGRRWESQSKDYEFSRRSMLEHWAAGNEAVRKTMHKSGVRSEEHTSELQSLMRISYAVFC